MNDNKFDPEKYWEERLGNSYGLHGVGYISLGVRFNTWMYRVRKNVFMREAGGLFKEGSPERVLDVGSGTGFYVDLWQKLGAGQVTGLDITDVAVENLKKNFPNGRFLKMDVAESTEGLEEASFDAVSAMDVLFHIVDDERYARAVKNIYGLLRPGGWFLYSDNFIRGQEVRLGHQVSRSLQDIEKTMKDAGFELVKRRPMFVLMNYPHDTSNKAWQSLWKKFEKKVSKRERRGWLAGAMLYPVELLLVRLFKESPTTEIMVLKKPG